MTSTPKKDNLNSESKIGLGEKTDSGYKYSSRINFKEDLSIQIAKLMQEKKAKDELETHVEQIRKISSRFKDKEKNLNYYTAVGKILSFLSSSNFKNIKPYSVFRRLIDEVPDVLPGLDAKRIQDHLMMMYKISGIDDDILNRATWEQWYEITKFKGVVQNKDILKKITEVCGTVSGGPDLRDKIKEILRKK